MTDEQKTHGDSEQHRRSDDDPTGGHDPAALEDAARKFHVDRTKDDQVEDDPTGGHDPEALDEAARRMKTKG
jgi:hypothetical protein